MGTPSIPGTRVLVSLCDVARRWILPLSRDLGLDNDALFGARHDARMVRFGVRNRLLEATIVDPRIGFVRHGAVRATRVFRWASVSAVTI